MATNKERIENLEVGLRGLQNSFNTMEKGVNDKLHHLEEAINKMTALLMTNSTTASSNDSHNQPEGNRSWFSSKLAKLEFPRFFGDDPMEWFTKVEQFFEYQGTTESQKIFHAELWARFGPTKGEDFDEALSKIKQFENLGNRVQGWTQRALVGTFMGGLKPEVADGIRMFKPTSLKEAISLAQMRDE
ncbi:hypothetical protein P3X46_012192 [Hevea brasiliensis]|uniref:Retrotransposon gag domain-containing protein n=1 Tax=Hevea brasiliensis TaxID=3981 RepID=A0ABQ9MD51_HEVBR|nr:hypothetical protein P3X46_012192 [Hevea brasiliensis]